LLLTFRANWRTFRSCLQVIDFYWTEPSMSSEWVEMTENPPQSD